MKKILGLCVALCPMIANADTLDDKIASLIAEKNAKIAELEKCQKATGNLKIAGITTLGVSAIGVAVNVGEAVSLNKLDDKINAAQAQKANLDKQIGDARASKLAAERAAKEAEQKAREKALGEKELLAVQAEDNTCGPDSEQEIDVNFKNLLNASQAVYVNGAWVASICVDGYKLKNVETCTRDGQVIEYAKVCEAVVEEDVADSAEEVNEEVKEEEELHDGDSGESVVTPQNRKYHDMCTPEETAKIAYAAESWWYNGKCVVKSCQDGAYLIVKNGVSQGYCSKSCSPDQTSPWENGGTACDIAKKSEQQQPEPKKEENKSNELDWYYFSEGGNCKCYLVVDEQRFDTKVVGGNCGYKGQLAKCRQYLINQSARKNLKQTGISKDAKSPSVVDVKSVNAGVAEQKGGSTDAKSSSVGDAKSVSNGVAEQKNDTTTVAKPNFVDVQQMVSRPQYCKEYSVPTSNMISENCKTECNTTLKQMCGSNKEIVSQVQNGHCYCKPVNKIQASKPKCERRVVYDMIGINESCLMSCKNANQTCEITEAGIYKGQCVCNPNADDKKVLSACGFYFVHASTDWECKAECDMYAEYTRCSINETKFLYVNGNYMCVCNPTSEQKSADEAYRASSGAASSSQVSASAAMNTYYDAVGSSGFSSIK